MGELVQEALDGLQDLEALQENGNDSIWIAGDLLSRFHSNNRFTSGYPHIDAEIVTAQDAAQLKQALLQALEQCASPATKGSILWALKNTYDETLKPIYVAQLEDALHQIEGTSILLQAGLDCLRNLGEPVSEREGDGTSPTMTETAKDWQRARRYIEHLNPDKVIPFPFGVMLPKRD